MILATRSSEWMRLIWSGWSGSRVILMDYEGIRWVMRRQPPSRGRLLRIDHFLVRRIRPSSILQLTPSEFLIDSVDYDAQTDEVASKGLNSFRSITPPPPSKPSLSALSDFQRSPIPISRRLDIFSSFSDFARRLRNSGYSISIDYTMGTRWSGLLWHFHPLAEDRTALGRMAEFGIISMFFFDGSVLSSFPWRSTRLTVNTYRTSTQSLSSPSRHSESSPVQQSQHLLPNPS